VFLPIEAGNGQEEGESLRKRQGGALRGQTLGRIDEKRRALALMHKKGTGRLK